jgi:protein-S-isoprenylcysteine O-methyltransferase Ste14
MMRVILWPVDVLLFAVGPGPRFGNGHHEWTPVQDFAVWVGVGVAFAFWVVVAWFVVRVFFNNPRRTVRATQDEARPH